MPYQAELLFFKKLMANYHFQALTFDPAHSPETDLGLRRLLGLENASESRYGIITPAANTICFALDDFQCSYIRFLLPDSGEMMSIGPYLRQEMTDSLILSLLHRHHLSVSLLSPLRQYYASIPYLEDDSVFLTLIATLGETLWGSKDAFRMEYLESADVIHLSQAASDAGEPFSEAVDLKRLESRYDGERRLMHAVSHGQIHQAQMIISRTHENLQEQRMSDTLRSLRSYGIVLNTLLRKAAEGGGVHPMYIDKLSVSMLRRLDTTHTAAETLQLFNTMVHKYCLLVKNHSMQNYSSLVQQVILRIETDLTADLSLKAHAQSLNVNASYLSTVFKKETGITLTEYVNRTRVDHAIFLLNASDMQIQIIAQCCGIPDVNYFTKLFKRVIGKTPKEYRQDTRRLTAEY